MSSVLPRTNTSTRLPRAFVGIHDKTPAMRILYVSSGLYTILNTRPEEILGHEAHGFLPPDDGNTYQTTYGPLSQENVSQFYTSLTRSDGSPLHLRVIHFDCDGVALNACFVTDPDEHSSGLASSLTIATNRAPDPANSGTHRVITSMPLSNGTLNIARVIARRNAAAAANARQPGEGSSITRRACLIIDKVTESSERNPMGSRIIFASSSLSRITNTDPCSVEGTPFLSLVPPEDFIKTARFLEQVSKSNDVVIDCLRFTVLGDPTDHNSRRVSSGSPKAVDIEVMAAGSEDGIILLCQQSRCGRVLPGGAFDSEGYLSLEEIISSDVESSDFPEHWTHPLN
ncbi:hypothetical protein EV175_003336 [Coemansia sp. RSA 1933]|nr:hypothetical protein EV175_003336 [Coemansia sp. RSA 1933]